MAKKKATSDEEKPTKSTVNIPADLNRQIEEYIEASGQTKQGFFIWLVRKFFKDHTKLEDSNS